MIYKNQKNRDKNEHRTNASIFIKMCQFTSQSCGITVEQLISTGNLLSVYYADKESKRLLGLYLAHSNLFRMAFCFNVLTIIRVLQKLMPPVFNLNIDY